MLVDEDGAWVSLATEEWLTEENLSADGHCLAGWATVEDSAGSELRIQNLRTGAHRVVHQLAEGHSRGLTAWLR